MREIIENDIIKIMKCSRCSNFIEGKDIKSILKWAEEDEWKADEETDMVFCPECAREKDEEEQREWEERKQDERSLIQQMARQQVGRKIL